VVLKFISKLRPGVGGDSRRRNLSQMNERRQVISGSGQRDGVCAIQIINPAVNPVHKTIPAFSINAFKNRHRPKDFAFGTESDFNWVSQTAEGEDFMLRSVIIQGKDTRRSSPLLQFGIFIIQFVTALSAAP